VNSPPSQVYPTYPCDLLYTSKSFPGISLILALPTKAVLALSLQAYSAQTYGSYWTISQGYPADPSFANAYPT